MKITMTLAEFELLVQDVHSAISAKCPCDDCGGADICHNPTECETYNKYQMGKELQFTVKLSNTDEVSVIYDGVAVNEDGTVNVMFASPDIYANGEDDGVPMGEDNYLLTDDEYNVLNRLSALSKMDCWFCLAMDDDETYDYVEDLESDEDMTLRAGVSQLNEGLIEENLARLSDKERKTYKELLIKLAI